MRVFKFGGASVKDAEGVRNLVKVLNEVGHKDTILVVSAMGKTTNAMEDIVNSYFKNKLELAAHMNDMIAYHEAIMLDLFANAQHPVFKKVKVLVDEINGFLAWNKSPNYNFVYDQVVGYGELISTTILSAYLQEVGIANTWLDVR